MAEFLIRIVVNALALVAAVRLVPGAAFQGDLLQLAAVAAIFGLINAYLRPIMKLLSLPLNLVAFGLVGFAVNTVLLLLLALVFGGVGLFVEGLKWALIVGLALVVVGAVSGFRTHRKV